MKVGSLNASARQLCASPGEDFPVAGDDKSGQLSVPERHNAVNAREQHSNAVLLQDGMLKLIHCNLDITLIVRALIQL